MGDYSPTKKKRGRKKSLKKRNYLLRNTKV